MAGWLAAVTILFAIPSLHCLAYLMSNWVLLHFVFHIISFSSVFTLTNAAYVVTGVACSSQIYTFHVASGNAQTKRLLRTRSIRSVLCCAALTPDNPSYGRSAWTTSYGERHMIWLSTSARSRHSKHLKCVLIAASAKRCNMKMHYQTERMRCAEAGKAMGNMVNERTKTQRNK